MKNFDKRVDTFCYNSTLLTIITSGDSVLKKAQQNFADHPTGIKVDVIDSCTARFGQ
jgi:hypothetical protein